MPVTVCIVSPFTDSLQWSKLHDEDIPARYEHASFTTSTGDLFIFAGAQTTGPLNDVWKYQFCKYYMYTYCMCSPCNYSTDRDFKYISTRSAVVYFYIHKEITLSIM